MSAAATLDRLRTHAALARKQHAEEKMDAVVRLAQSAAAYGIGAAERSSKLPTSFIIPGTTTRVPTKAAVAVVAQVGALLTKGKTRRMFRETASLSLALYGYSSGRAGTLIAGE
jgi:hypothetical protein